jgi:hypothetical protein
MIGLQIWRKVWLYLFGFSLEQLPVTCQSCHASLVRLLQASIALASSALNRVPRAQKPLPISEENGLLEDKTSKNGTTIRGMGGLYINRFLESRTTSRRPHGSLSLYVSPPTFPDSYCVTVYPSFFFVHSHCNYEPYTSDLFGYSYPSFLGYRISLAGFIPMFRVLNFRVAPNQRAQHSTASTFVIHLKISIKISISPYSTIDN